MKWFGKVALVTLLSASVFLPSETFAAGPQQSSTKEAAPAATETQVLSFERGTKGYSDSAYFYINSPTVLTVKVTQSGINVDNPLVEYKIYRQDGTDYNPNFGYALFPGTGSFSFQSDKVLPIGQYYIRVSNNGAGKVRGTVSVITP
ncbi:hypothetical protein B5G50_20125 [Brevibacillus brevis]|uniref:hypothetical protein n=1 Tax=Brevibacillus brevis TaxID=1393 RepID=UPI000B368AD9|nr:hypothetical protein [Brevibacillus brevis]OUQ86520.1 hypothetical protein B5G50_20125 [Brevibacillus brevis]